MSQLFKSHGASLINSFTVILLVLLLISVLSITTLWYIDTKNQIESRYLLQKNHTEQTLHQSVIWIDSGIRLYEYSFEPGLKSAMNQYLDVYNTSKGEIDAINLVSLKNQFNQTYGGIWDLYIINSDGMIEKTTYKPDIYLNFSHYKSFFKTLSSIRENGDYVVDRTVKGFVKGSPNRKFVYQGTPDKKYILEISRNFEDFIPPETKSSYEELLKTIPELNPDVVAVELYNVQGEIVTKWNASEVFIPNTPELQQSILNTYTNKTNTAEIDSKNHQETTYIYLPIHDTRHPSSPMMNLAARVVYSTEKIQRTLVETTIIYLIILLCTLLLSLLAVWQTSKLFSKPVKGLIGDLNLIADGKLDHKIRSTGILELQQIESAINRLVKNLKSSILTLRDQEIQIKNELIQRIQAEENIKVLLSEVQEKEQEIKNSEQRYRSVVETQNEYICRYTPDGTHIFTNEAYCRLFGKKCVNILGTKLSLKIPADEIAGVREHFSSLTPDHPVDLNEHHIILPNGESRYIQWVDQAFFSDDETVIEYQSVGRDLTELKKLEKSLHESDALYRETVNAMDDGIFVTDKTQTIIIHNIWKKGRKEGLIKPLKDFTGKSLFSILTYLNEPDYLNYEYVFHTGNIFVSEKTLNQNDQMTIETKIIPIFDDGQVTTVVTIIRDISARKQAEKALQKLNRDLEEIIWKRTEDLQESLDELDAFAYSVSHDLRAPVRAIDGFSHLLLMKNSDLLNEESKHLIVRIREGVMTMDRLIQDLLRFSRTGRQPLYVIDIDMANLVRGVITELTSQPESRNISVKIFDLPHAKGDTGLIRQVWFNLISNSIKFTPHPTIPDITIGSYEKEKEIIYYIKDNGVGFDMQYADKIFEVFSRLTPSSEVEGTGVGLALVKRIIIRHHGRIWVQSESGKGTTFYFTMQGTDGDERRQEA